VNVRSQAVHDVDAARPDAARPDDGRSVVEQILELARWAPSGDNSQPWRFEVVSQEHVVVHAFDTRRHCVYDLEGHASQLAVGALLETMRIAASEHARALTFEHRPASREEAPVFDVRIEPAPGVAVDPLHAFVRQRSVQRKPLSTRPLEPASKQRLEGALGDGFSVIWFETKAARRRLAWLAAHSAKIRLTIPEAYAVHREIIEWNVRYSEERVPDQALGADALTLRSMRWALASWPRVQRMNRWFGGTLAPRLQLDLVPGLRCAAHFAIIAHEPSATLEDRLRAGAAVQRFWLTAAALGLQLQPQHTPLVFADYARKNLAFTSVAAARRRAASVAGRLASLLAPQPADQAVFLGRIGHGPAPTARSVRLPLERLWWRGEERLGDSRRSA
jgi:nitroreductase